MSDLDQVKAALACVRRIAELSTSHTDNARNLVQIAQRQFEQIQVTFPSDRWGQEITARHSANIVAIKTELRAKIIAEAEAERDAKLLEIAAELRAQADVLCALAAKAACAAGAIARDLRKEATHDR